MKKFLKNLGLAWLTALTLGWEIKDGISQTTQETSKNIQTSFAETKNWKGDKSQTYFTTSDEFKEKKTNESIDVTQAIKQTYTDTEQLVKFYGKEELNKKVHQIMKDYPNFWNLTEEKQKTIMEKYFADFLKKESDKNAIIGGIAFSVVALWAISLHASLMRSRRRRWYVSSY